jgi:hypothetical protein
MALNYITAELLTDWCSRSEEIADVRAKARSDFFGYYGDEPPKYPGDSGELNRRERRFLGYLAFSFELADGRRPSELAAMAFLRGRELDTALKAIRAARYVTGAASRIDPGRGFHLQVEDEGFGIESSALSRIIDKGQLVSAHLIGTSRGRYLLAPGWLAWPITAGPGMRGQLKSVFQPNPIEVERFLQGRASKPDESGHIERPEDDTLEAAVARMSEAAREAGRTGLIMSAQEWQKVILPAIRRRDMGKFAEELHRRAGGFETVDDANTWLALATNIWNNTPQPDRGGKSAKQMVREAQRHGPRQL